MKNKIDITYLGDVLDAIKRIENHLRRVDKKGFQENLMMQDAVMYQIEIIGEASNNVSEEYQKNTPNYRGFKCEQFETKLSTIIGRSIST